MSKKEKSIINLLNNKHYLELLSDTNTQKNIKKAILSKANKNLIKAIEECVLNLLNGNIPISPDDLEKLKEYKYILRRLIKKSNLSTKKKILVQRGGFLQIILPAVITGLSTIVASLIKNQE